MNIMFSRKGQPLTGDAIIGIDRMILDDDTVKLYRWGRLTPFKEFEISTDVTGLYYVSTMPNTILRYGHGTYEGTECTISAPSGMISRSKAPYIEIIG